MVKVETQMGNLGTIVAMYRSGVRLGWMVERRLAGRRLFEMKEDWKRIDEQ